MIWLRSITVYKYDRLHHSRKHSKLHSMADMFNLAMDTSDTIILCLNSRPIKNTKAFHITGKPVIIM